MSVGNVELVIYVVTVHRKKKEHSQTHLPLIDFFVDVVHRGQNQLVADWLVRTNEDIGSTMWRHSHIKHQTQNPQLQSDITSRTVDRHTSLFSTNPLLTHGGVSE